MLKGKCEKCGKIWYGWALGWEINPGVTESQEAEKKIYKDVIPKTSCECGGKIEIEEG